MGGHFRPVSTKEVEAVLKHLGYKPREQKATSHVNWVIGEGTPQYRRVTVDANNAPFKDKALAFMLTQMGIKKADFYAILSRL